MRLLTFIRERFPRILSKFFIVGILNTIVGYGLFDILIFWKTNYILALTVSHIFATTHSYVWNRLFTFKSKATLKGEFAKFVFSYFLIYALNFILLYIFVGLFNKNIYLCQFVILVIVTAVSFGLQKYWTFKN